MFTFLLVPVVAVNIAAAPCPTGAEIACYVPRSNTVYVEPAHWNDRAERREILAHELGHAYDYKVMTETDREFLRDSLEVRGQEWKPDRTSPGSEAFANYYQDCAMGHRYWRNRFVCNWLWGRAPYRLFRRARLGA